MSLQEKMELLYEQRQKQQKKTRIIKGVILTKKDIVELSRTKRNYVVA